MPNDPRAWVRPQLALTREHRERRQALEQAAQHLEQAVAAGVITEAEKTRALNLERHTRILGGENRTDPHEALAAALHAQGFPDPHQKARELIRMGAG